MSDARGIMRTVSDDDAVDPPESAAGAQLALEFAAPPKQGCPSCGRVKNCEKQGDAECRDWSEWRQRERLRFHALNWDPTA